MEEVALTNKQAEALIVAEFAKVSGRVIYVDDLTGYINDSDQIDLRLKIPVAVRVTGPKDEGGLFHYVGEWLDPYWDIEIVDANHPEIPEGFRSSYMYGHSVNTETGVRSMAKFRFAKWWERALKLIPLPLS